MRSAIGPVHQSLREKPAVDRQRVAGDHPGSLGREEHDRVGNLGRLGQLPHRRIGVTSCMRATI